MPELKPEETFRNWIISFHKLRIQGFLNDKECKSCWKRICKVINKEGYTVEDAGFYQWEFKKIKSDEK